MPAPLGELGADEFLRDYWQKKPCLIRQAFPGFVPELDGDDLAGLACEPDAEARIVQGSYAQHDWELRHGPFDEQVFAALPETRWTLLVQDVEKHYPPLMSLLEQFGFLPTWRLDDLMVSYAVPGGSVGPHVDQYDVFLLQAEGTRRWTIARQFDPELLADCPLNVLRAFEPEEEWVLEPGDLLYLPPGIAHHGVALTPGMTWSIGLRAPDTADLLMALGEKLAEAGEAVARYADPRLGPATRPGEIDAAALKQLRALMLAPLHDTESFHAFVGEFLTRFRLAQVPAPPDSRLSVGELASRLGAGERLYRNPWTRLAWLQSGEGARLYAAGAAFTCSVGLAQQLCACHELDLPDSQLTSGNLETLTRLVNAGHLVLGADP